MGETRRVLPEWARFALSLVFLFVVAIATAGLGTPFFLAIMLSAAVAIAVLQLLFPVGRLFPIAFANLIAVYAAIFSLFVEEVFKGVDPAILSIHVAEPLANTAIALIAAMTLIGLIVFTVSRDVAIFLVDAGLLFEEFFFRIQRLVVPAFAFLTFYSLLIILFASAYHILSQYTGKHHFYVGGSPQVLSFSESIYFSIVSISTVGYGDIVPHSSVARLLASIEVVCGFMLLLFGVSELLEYTRERREEDGKPRRPPRR